MQQVTRSVPPAPGESADRIPVDASWAVLDLALPVGLYLTDPAGAFTAVNARWCELTGLTADEARGDGWTRALHPDDRERVLADRSRRIATGGRMTSEYRFLRPDGSVVWVLDQAIPRQDATGATTGYAGSVTDITDHKRGEEDLRGSEARLRALAEATASAIWTIDATGDLLDAPIARWPYLTDLPPEALAAEWLAAVHPDDRAPGNAVWWAGVAEGRPFEFEQRVRQRDGSFRHYAVRAVPVRAEDGTVREWVGADVDVTDRRRAEAALRESEERYRTLVERTDQGFCIFEMLYGADGRPVDYRFLEVNPAFERHTGLKDAVGKTARALVPGLEEHWVETYGRVAETGEPHRFDQGSAAMGRWFEVDAVRVGGDGSRKVALLFADVSERKLAEERLRESERRLQVMANAMPQVVWVADPDGTVRYYNDRVAAFAGVRQTENGTWDWQPMFHPDDLGPTLAAWERAVRERAPYAHEHRIRMADGACRWHLSRADPVLDATGEIAAWYGTATDIDEIKEAERELEQRRREFETLVEHSPDMVARVDRDLRYRYVNPAHERLTEIPAAHVIGKTNAELGLPAGFAAPDEVRAREVVERRQEQYFEYDFPARDGVRHLRTRLVPEVAPDGSIATILAVTYDVTERVRAEVERQTLLDALAHDLKNPLAALKAQAQMLRRQIARRGVPDAEDLAERVAGFEGLANRMTELVEELGDHARLAMGQPVELDPEETDLVALVRDAVEEIRQTAGPHEIRFETNADEVIGVWDARRLRRVAANLLGNAVKYSPAGGEVLVRLTRTDGEATLAVRDPGIGIPAADLPHVFQFRHRAGNVGAIAGSGIGLAGAKRIVEQHGGAIAVASEEGHGSTFTVRLPLAAEPPA